MRDTHQNPPQGDRLMRRREVERRVGCKSTKLRALVAENRLPRPVVIGPRMHRWSEREVEAAIARIEHKPPAATS